MPDHKWDRFKRLFGASDSDALVQVRLGKVNAAIQRLQDAVTSMQERGLPTLLLNASLVHLTQRRDVATQLPNNRQQALTLQGIKRDARRAASQAEATAQQQLQTLDLDLETHSARVRKALVGVSNMRCPLVVSLLATPRQQLETARDNAEDASTDHRKRNAYASIDTDTVTKLIAQLKPLNADYGKAKARIRDVGWDLDKLPEDEATRRWAVQLLQLKNRLDDLDSADELDEAKDEAKSLCEDATELQELTGAAKLKYEGELLALEGAKRRVATAIERAEAITHKMGKAIVDEAVKSVKQAQQLALQKVGRVAITKALDEIDLQPLLDATIQSSTLDQGVPKLMSAITETLKDVTDEVALVALDKRLDALLVRQATANDEGDLSRAKELFVALKTDAKKLMDDVIEAVGEDGFKRALESRFDLEIKIKEGAIVDLERTYRMMELVPESHVGHDKCKILNFEPKPTSGAVGSYSGGTINMKGMSNEKTDTYELDNHTHTPNLFSVTMLHEIGHAVDDEYSIMSGLMDSAGYGVWRRESRESVHAVLKDAAIEAMGDLELETQTKVDEAIGLALAGKDFTRPDGLSRRQWKALQKYTTIATKIRDKAQPYFNSRIAELAVGGRVYLEAYSSSDKWYSFSISERQSQRVNNYQWRAPGEWFAEIYAICWIKNMKKPAGVGTKLDRWLPAVS